jgi:hypothetical protein
MKNSWQPASRELVRIFYAHNQHIAVVTGKKPRHCAAVDLIRSSRQSDLPTFSIIRSVSRESEPSVEATADRYYLVKPLLPGPARAHINVRHLGGIERVTVETLSTTGKETHAKRPIPTIARRKDDVESALGYSQNFSVDEAFNDALSHLPMLGDRRNNRPTLVDVVSMGAIYGGFSGFSRLFVKIEQSAARISSVNGQKRAPSRGAGS